jgi:peptidyl-prolyl cis-trans isomerase SurA
MQVKTVTFKMLGIILAVIGVLMPVCSQSPVSAQTDDTVLVDRIVAILNNEIITLYDLNAALKPYITNIKALGYSAERERETLFQVRRDLLDQLISRMLTDQEVKRLNIEISEIEIDRAIERIKESRSYTDEDLRNGLAQQGLTLEDYRKEIKEQILRTRVVNQEIKSKVVITSDDVKAYYDNHREKYAGEKKYKLWNLFYKIPSFAEGSDKQAGLDKMKALEARLKQGESFENLVATASDSDPLIQGSDLGMFRFDELSEQMQNAVENLKDGEYSPIIDSGFAYQIIYVEKIMETQTKSLASVESEIQETLYNEYVNARFEEWLQELRKRAHIKIIR